VGLRLQLRRHRRDSGLPDETPQLLFEPVALAAVLTAGQVVLRNHPLLLAEVAVEEGLQQLFGLVAWLDCGTTPVAAPPSVTARSASSRFRIRRPRCRRDITV